MKVFSPLWGALIGAALLLLASFGAPAVEELVDGASVAQEATPVSAMGITWAPADVAVSDPDTLFPGPEQAVFEPVIAIDPTDPDTMIAFAIDLSSQNVFPYPETWSDNRYFRSTDGGATWVDHGPMMWGPQPNDLDGGDPVAFFDQDGVAYFNGLADPQEEYRYLYVWRSHDGGATWDGPFEAWKPTVDALGVICTSVDKNWMSPGLDAGELLLTYTASHFRCALGDDPTGAGELAALNETGIYLRRSTDGGETWAPETKVWNGYALGSVPREAPDGTLHVAFWATVPASLRPCPSVIGTAVFPTGGGGPFAAVVVATSHDDGTTWSYHIQGTCDFYLSSQVEPGFYGGGNIMPTMQVDEATGAVYVAYPTFLVEEQRHTIELIVSTDGGLTWSDPVDVTPGPDGAHLPALAVDDGTVRLLYVLSRLDGTGAAALIASDDGAASWSEPFLLSSESMDLAAGDIGDYVTLDMAAAGRIAAIWTDARTSPTEIRARIGDLAQI